MTDTLPASARSELASALPTLEAAAAPADARAFAVAIEDLFRWVQAYGIVTLPPEGPARDDWFAERAADYRRDLLGLPEDLLHQAVRATIETHKHRNLPTPAEIRAHVSAELARRKVRLQMARSALRFGRFERDPVPASERIRPDQLAAAQQMMAAARLRDIPGADTSEVREAHDAERVRGAAVVV